MTETILPPYLTFEASSRRLRLDPHEPEFYQNPYEAYAWLYAQGGVFFWEEFGRWCFGNYDDVSRLLRDRLSPLRTTQAAACRSVSGRDPGERQVAWGRGTGQAALRRGWV